MKEIKLSMEELVKGQLDRYKSQISKSKTTEEVVSFNNRLDTWLKKKLSTEKEKDGPGELIDFLEKIRFTSTVVAVKRVKSINDGQKIKDISYRLGIPWNNKTIVDAFDCLKKLEEADTSSLPDEEKVKQYRKCESLLMDLLNRSSSTERLYTVYRMKDIYLKSLMAKVLKTISPTGEEKEKSSAKREREGMVNYAGIYFDLFDEYDKLSKASSFDNVMLYYERLLNKLKDVKVFPYETVFFQTVKGIISAMKKSPAETDKLKALYERFALGYGCEASWSEMLDKYAEYEKRKDERYSSRNIPF